MLRKLRGRGIWRWFESEEELDSFLDEIPEDFVGIMSSWDGPGWYHISIYKSNCRTWIQGDCPCGQRQGCTVEILQALSAVEYVKELKRENRMRNVGRE